MANLAEVIEQVPEHSEIITVDSEDIISNSDGILKLEHDIKFHMEDSVFVETVFPQTNGEKFKTFLKNERNEDIKSKELDRRAPQYKKWSHIWKFFVELKRGRAQCKVCSKCISFTKSTTSNLARHLRVVHSILFTFATQSSELFSGAAITNNTLNTNVDVDDDMKYFFSKVNDSEFVCHLCEARLSTADNFRKHLRSHIKSIRVESLVASETGINRRNYFRNLSTNSNMDEEIEEIDVCDITENEKDTVVVTVPFKRSKIWKYFVEQDKCRATCVFCGRILSFSCGTTSNLSRHLQLMHREEQVDLSK